MLWVNALFLWAMASSSLCNSHFQRVMIFPPSSGISQPRLIPVLLLVNALQVGDGQSLQDFPIESFHWLSHLWGYLWLDLTKFPRPCPQLINPHWLINQHEKPQSFCLKKNTTLSHDIPMKAPWVFPCAPGAGGVGGTSSAGGRWTLEISALGGSGSTEDR